MKIFITGRPLTGKTFLKSVLEQKLVWNNDKSVPFICKPNIEPTDIMVVEPDEIKKTARYYKTLGQTILLVYIDANEELRRYVAAHDPEIDVTAFDKTCQKTKATFDALESHLNEKDLNVTWVKRWHNDMTQESADKFADIIFEMAKYETTMPDTTRDIQDEDVFLVLWPKDWTKEEWNTICTLFHFNSAHTESITVSHATVKASIKS